MKGWLAGLAAGLLLFGCTPTAEESVQPSLYPAGEYHGTAMGYQGELEVSVLLTDSHIDEIRVPVCPETTGIGAVVVEQLPGLIVANQTLQVDVVAGATVTSRALLDAVQQAVESSGADLTPLLEEPEEPVSPSLQAQVTEADLVIVGAGGAGLTAAAAAAQVNPDLDIVLLEKTGAVGGDTLRAEDGVNAAGTSVQQQTGVEDGFERMLFDTLAVSGGEEAEPLEVLVGDSSSAIEWLAGLGIPLDALRQLDGSTVERTHFPSDGTPIGQALVDGLADAVQQAGVTLCLNTQATGLVTDAQGRICGVIAESPGVRHYYTGRAVILATGGFAANDRLCGSYRTLLRGLDTVSGDAAQGEGITIAQALGAATVDMQQVLLEPTVHRGSAQIVPRSLREAGAILVSREGEPLEADPLNDAALSEELLAQSGRCGWMIFGEGLLHLLPETLQPYLVSGEDPAALAQSAGLPVEALEAVVETRNAELPETADETGNERYPARLEGTLYALEVAPGIQSTLGGLEITADAEVIGADGNPIPGLYAAGEVAGGIHGEQVLPGNMLTDLLVFGRRAGQNAAILLSQGENGDDV